MPGLLLTFRSKVERLIDEQLARVLIEVMQISPKGGLHIEVTKHFARRMPVFAKCPCDRLFDLKLHLFLEFLDDLIDDLLGQDACLGVEQITVCQ